MDLRIPVGILFVLIGGLLAAYGAITRETAQVDPGVDTNLIWGVVMLLFGALIWSSARFGRRKERD